MIDSGAVIGGRVTPPGRRGIHQRYNGGHFCCFVKHLRLEAMTA